MQKTIWGILMLFAAVFVVSARPLQAQSACYHCSYSSTDGTSFCHPISPEGGRSNCARSGIESESSCSTSGSSCSTSAIRDVAPDGGLSPRFASTTQKQGESLPLHFAGMDSGKDYVRRPCDGAVVARKYDRAVADQMHRAAREIAI